MRWWCREGNFDYGTNLDDKKVFFLIAIAASIINNKNITNNSWIAKVEWESISLCIYCLMFLFLSLLISLKLCTQTVLFVSSSIVIFSMMMNWRYVVRGVLQMNFWDFWRKFFKWISENSCRSYGIGYRSLCFYSRMSNAVPDKIFALNSELLWRKFPPIFVFHLNFKF